MNLICETVDTDSPYDLLIDINHMQKKSSYYV